MKVCAAAGNERRRPIISAPAAISGRYRHRLDRKMLKCCSCGETPRPEAKSTSTGATRSVKPKRTERPSAAQKASAAQSGVKSVSVPTVLGQNVSEADAEKHSEWSIQTSDAKHECVAPQPDTKEVHQKSAQQLEAERQQKLENLRAAMQKQICTIHVDVELPANGQNDSEAAEQKLHILLYKSTLPENDLNQALDELRTERRRQKAEYQGAPFADVFLVNLILSDEDSERACIVDVGAYGHELCHSMEQHPAGASAAAAPLCGTGGRKALRLLQRGPLQHRKRTNDRGAVSGQTGTSRFEDIVLKIRLKPQLLQPMSEFLTDDGETKDYDKPEHFVQITLDADGNAKSNRATVKVEG